MDQKKLYKVFIWGFLFLYLLVAGISFCHAIQFFCIGNQIIMSVILAFAFELGLALSLAAVLLSDANKKATLPWILMTILTFVQVIGNVYSVEKFICESDAVYYQYLSNALLFWIEGVSEQTVQVIISWIMGAILPIIALFMTDMVATNIKNMAAAKDLEDHVNPELSESDDESIEIQEDKTGTSGETVPIEEPVEELPENPVKNEFKDIIQNDIDDTQKVEVKSVDPVEVKHDDKPTSSNKISERLKNLFVKKDEPQAGSVIVNAPALADNSKRKYKILGGDFVSPETIE